MKSRPLPNEVRIRDDEMRGTDVRVAYIWVPVAVPGAKPVLVQVGETLEKRSVLATEIIKGVMLPQFVTLPLAVLLVWLALVRGIRPLNKLEERIRLRKPDDLSPLDDSEVPQEVSPLVASINDLLTRLKESIATQKRFLADAAHQLKTPLAGLRMQADLAQREGSSADELKQSLKLIGRASIRATHTVNQLLSLARAESGSTHIARSPCDLVALVTLEVVQDSLAARHGQVPSTWAMRVPKLGHQRSLRLDGPPDLAQRVDPQLGGQRHQLHPVKHHQAGRDHGTGVAPSRRSIGVAASRRLWPWHRTG
jgi:two-component system, OmpR family, sensor histidine kinase TctE